MQGIPVLTPFYMIGNSHVDKDTDYFIGGGQMKKNFKLSEVLLLTIANTLLYFVIRIVEFQSLFISILAFLGLSFFITVGLFFLTSRKVYKMIEAVKNSLKQFNDGNFTSSIKVETKQQELLSVIEEFEKLKLMMNTWVYELLKSSVSIKLSAGRISDSSENTSQSMQNLNQNLSDISQFFEDTTQMMDDVAAATTQLAQSSSSIAENSHSAVKKAKDANEAAIDGGESMMQVSQSMNQIRKNVSDASHTIENLKYITNQIEGITQTITTISKQTTMLALNAAIESARAGEQGKGFAVVAQEVGKLSVETGKAANQINALVSNIGQEVFNAVGAMKQVSEEVDKGVYVTDHAKENLDSMIHSIENTVALIENISKDINQQSQGTGLISKNTSIVAEKGQTGTTSVQEIAGVVEIQLEAVQHNDDSAKELLAISNSLEVIMNRFDITLGKQMLEVCSYIAKLHDKQALTYEDLLRLCKETGLTEIHLADETGTIFESNNKSIKGFRFSTKEGDQTEEFTRILKDSTLAVNQKAAFREVDGKLFKYTGIAMLHKKGIVQCGLDASKMSEFIGV